MKTQTPTFVYWLGVMLIEKSKLKLWLRYSPHNYRDGSRGRVQGVGIRPPPLPHEMTCSFLTQLVFCIKICLHHQSVTPFLSGAPPPKKRPGSTPEIGGFMMEVKNPGSPPELIEPVNKLFGVGWFPTQMFLGVCHAFLLAWRTKNTCRGG